MFVPISYANSADTISNWDQVSGIIKEYSWVGTVAGAGISYLSAQKHDQMIAAYFAEVLAALDQINNKLDILKTTTCNIYQHSNNQDYAAFQRQLTDYLVSADRIVFFENLFNLQNSSTAIIAQLEDHTNLLANCALDQYEFLAIYMTMSNIDLSIQAEYIRNSYYIAYRMQANGTLIPLDQMDPAARTTMENLITTDIKTKLALRMARIVDHLKVLDGVNADGTASPFSWRNRSDKRFSALSTFTDSYTYRLNKFTAPITYAIRRVGRYALNGQVHQFAWYHKDFAPLYGLCCEHPANRAGPAVTLPRFSSANDIWVTIPNPGRTPNECIYLRRKLVPKGSILDAPKSGACQHFTKTPSVTSIFSAYHPQIFQGDFAYLNLLDATQYATYEANPNKIYTTHKDDKYREIVASELVPILALVEQWRSEVNAIDAPSVADVPPIPSFTAVIETQ